MLLPDALPISAQHRLPAGTYTLQPGALEIHSEHFSDIYIFGYGWASGAALPDPVIVGQGVSVSAELLALVTGELEGPAVRPTPAPFEPAPLPAAPAFADPPAAPPAAVPAGAAISDVRFGGSGEVRVVFDLTGLSSAVPLVPLVSRGWQIGRAHV